MAETKEIKKNTSAVVAKVVRTVMSNARHATAKTKKRGEISGGGKKPWKQKGTGRARAGSSRSPIWRGGGIVFGPTGVQNYNIKASKKEKIAATKSAFETKRAHTFKLETPKFTKTKDAAAFLKKNDIEGSALLLVVEEKVAGQKQSTEMTELKRVFRNIPNVRVMFKQEANSYDILNAGSIVILEPKLVKAKTESKV